jgi:hypothetical protein
MKFSSCPTKPFCPLNVLRENLADLYHEAIGSPGNGRRLDTSRRRKNGGAV